MWVWPGSDDQGRLYRFLANGLEALGRRGLTAGGPSPLIQARPLSLIDDLPWAGVGVAVRPREGLPDYQNHEFGNDEVRRILRQAEEMEQLPIGAIGLVAAWVGSSESSNIPVDGEVTFQPVLKLLREHQGSLQVYSFDDAFLDEFAKVIPVRAFRRGSGEAVVSLDDEVRALVEQVARGRFEQAPSWAARARQAALDLALPKPFSLRRPKSRF